MRSDPDPVLGVRAPRAKPTAAGAFWLAAVLSLPVAVLGLVLELLLRWLF